MGNKKGSDVKYNAYHALAREKFPTYRKEYRGMLKSQIIYKSALDFSDNGRCWWIKNKLIEYVYNPTKPRGVS